ncbi:hypothetical protein EGW08_018499, partial [Elysia chlorotica]
MDFPGIIEEIALEGLEGITIEALWKRLENRPGFSEQPLDADSQRYIWSLLIRHSALQFFVLPEPRPELVIFRYNDCVTKGSLKCTLPEEVCEDIYSRTMVAKNGVMGCCDHFDTREDITEEIRGHGPGGGVSLEYAMHRWGQTLVIVASQRCRDMILLQSCDKPVHIEFYSFLELIGRSRYDGEVTFCRNRRGLCNPLDKNFSSPTNTFSRLDALISLGLVTKQVFIMTYQKPHWVNQVVRLFHLKRFYTASQANYTALLTSLTAHLSNAPDKTAPFYNILKELDIKPELFYKASKRAGNYFSVSNVTRRSYFKDDSAADKDNAEHERSIIGTSSENRVKLVTLLRAFRSSEHLEEDEDKEESIMEDDNEETPVAVEETVDSSNSALSHSIGLPSVDDSILHQVVALIQAKGEWGINPSIIKKKLNLERTHMKYIEKELRALKVFHTVKRFLGKQRAEMWVLTDPAKKEQEKTQTEDDRENSEQEKQSDMSLVEADAPGEAWSITPEEEAELDATLEKIKVTCTIERTESPASTSEKDDPVKAARKRLILHKLKNKRVYSSRSNIFQEVSVIEKEKGWKMKVCRKSVARIIDSLFLEGRLEYLNVQLCEKEDVSRQMIIYPGVGLADPFIKKAVVEHANAVLKFKENRRGSKKGGSQAVSELSKPDDPFSIYSAVANMGLISVFKILTSGLEGLERKGEHVKKSKTNISKMERTKSMHEYLHYVLYAYTGCTDGVPQKQDVLEEIAEPLPVYLDVQDWRRYLPPLYLHNDSALRRIHAGPGACMIGDIMLNFPLITIWNLFNRPSELKEVMGHFVEDPGLLCVPLCRLPKQIILELTTRKRLMPRLTEELNLMAHMGLLSFGPRQRCNNMEF